MRPRLGFVPPYDAPFPIEIAQDLLAIARALHVHFSALGPAYDTQTLKLRGIGAQLHLAIERGTEGAPGTFKGRAAYLITENALRDLAVLMADVPAGALIEAVGARFARKAGTR